MFGIWVCLATLGLLHQISSMQTKEKSLSSHTPHTCGKGLILQQDNEPKCPKSLCFTTWRPKKSRECRPLWTFFHIHLNSTPLNVFSDAWKLGKPRTPDIREASGTLQKNPSLTWTYSVKFNTYRVEAKRWTHQTPSSYCENACAFSKDFLFYLWC